jgi:hypothetical protein
MPVRICGHLLDLPLPQPLVKLAEPSGRRGKSPKRFLDGPFLLAEQSTSDDGFLVHIQAATAFIHDLHSLSPFRKSFCL